MKNVYFYIVFLLIGFNGFGQDLQNARWRFGYHASLDFLSNPNNPIAATSNMDIKEGCASVSDQSGNLLFYSNGSSIWNSSNQKILDGLYGNDSSTQSVIIVPKPGNTNVYYIVTIDGISGGQRGLHYSQVTMSGFYLSVTNINIVFKNHLGVNINESYHNYSEKLTATKHANGIDYWIVAQVNERIYSYKVSSTGIDTMPEMNTLAPINTFTQTTPNDRTPGIGCMKISPNGNYIGIAYRNIGIGPTESGGAVAFGVFNSTTGGITFNQNLIVPILSRYYGLEFSPQNKYLYFTTDQLYRYNIATGGLQNLASLGSEAGSLQRAINGKIYYTEFQNGHFLGVVNDPDNEVNPNFQPNVVDLGVGSQAYGLPQWVPWQAPCPLDLILVSTSNDIIASAQDFRQAQNTITASNVVNNGAVGIYHAGTDVLLTSGFYSASGSIFRGYIEDCSNQYVGLSATAEENMKMSDIETVTDESTKDLFTLYPNPATDRTTVISDKIMTNITVTGLDGYTLFKSSIKGNSFDLNISDYPKGFYIITVTTESGEMEMEKLIKK